MKMLQIFVIMASGLVLLIRGDDNEEEEEEAHNNKCSNISSMVNDNLDAFILETTFKQKLNQKPGRTR